MTADSRHLPNVTVPRGQFRASAKTVLRRCSVPVIILAFLWAGSASAQRGSSSGSQSRCESLFTFDRNPRSVQVMQLLVHDMVLLYEQVTGQEEGLVKHQLHRDFKLRWQRLVEEFGGDFLTAFQKQLSLSRRSHPMDEKSAEKTRGDQKQTLRTASDQLTLPGSHGIQIRENLLFSIHNQEMWIHDLLEKSDRKVGVIDQALAEHPLQITTDHRFIYAGLMNNDFLRIEITTGQTEILSLGLNAHEQPASPPPFFINQAGSHLTTVIDGVGPIIFDLQKKTILSRGPRGGASTQHLAIKESHDGRFQIMRVQGQGQDNVIFDLKDSTWVNAQDLKKWSTMPLEGFAFSPDSQYFFFAKPNQGSHVSNWIFRGHLKTLEFEPWLEIPADRATSGILFMRSLTPNVVLISAFARGIHYFRWDITSGKAKLLSLPPEFSSSEVVHYDSSSDSLYMIGSLKASVNKTETAIVQIKFIDEDSYETRMIQFTPGKPLNLSTMTKDQLFTQSIPLRFMNLEFAFSLAIPERHQN